MTKPVPILGQFGTAWQLDLKQIMQKHSLANQTALLAVWVMHCPNAHPIWTHYRLSLIHLRPQEGLPAAKMYLNDATHEITLYALHPDQPVPLDDLPIHVMTPVNFAAQFIQPSDEAAINHVRTQAVLPVIHGMLSPDEDHRTRWGQLFGDNMLRR